MKKKIFGMLFLLISFVIAVVAVASEPYNCEDYTECGMYSGCYLQSSSYNENATIGRPVAVDDPHEFLQDLIDNKHRFQQLSDCGTTIQDIIQDFANMIERGEPIFVVNFD